MAEAITPEQRARDVLALLKLPIVPGAAAYVLIASTIRAAETAAVEAERARCIETLRDMGMHETALMLRVTLEEADNHG